MLNICDNFTKSAFVWAMAFFPLWSIGYHILECVQTVGPWVFAHQTQALLLDVTAQCCSSPRNTTIMWIFLFSMYSLVSFFLVIPFFLKKNNFPFMKQYKLDVFTKQVPKAILQIIFKVTKSFQYVNQVKSYIVPCILLIVPLVGQRFKASF